MTVEDHLVKHHVIENPAAQDQTVEDHIGLPWYVLEDYRCFGCSPHNPHGIQLRFTHHGDGLRTAFSLGRAHESYPGVVHGGLLGVIADEIMGNLVVLRTGLIPFTTGMRLRYVLPVIVGGGYDCVAKVRDGGGQLVHTEAEIREDGGALVATATASYQTVSLDAAHARMSLDTSEIDRLRRALAARTATTATSPGTLSEEPHVSVD
ncbi:PaaI family thioesterase [Frankia sp. CNm7]|uniref:Acyl-coenzyme A thioesterase THEM4 n=1 Tax=Frankia nepalensis TaxID=1836974 RepID=A0A937RIE1_9ACTN|nr:PaaI family thioesterase [Frankia nepalensis]MBL7500517.1 PaaI family thioesterase [Frankia nepalensis]MBL7509789.1 PaaI family thioesterase [Frankia nepalensis]MBL7522195.1 PaaI family thioesterase [Frankia nepalensis]MBL7627909.1 PaaI family thioesterase [Frankia nepalensis]